MHFIYLISITTLVNDELIIDHVFNVSGKCTKFASQIHVILIINNIIS